ANSPFAIAVGAIDTHGTSDRADDTRAAFSSQGPTRYDLIVKPDLAAPGHHIQSSEAPGSYLATEYTDHHVTGSGTRAVMQLSGTSMAAGVVSGAAAILLDKDSNLKPLDLKGILEITSSFMPHEGRVGAGAGEMDLALATSFRGSTASIRRILRQFATLARASSNGMLATAVLRANQIVWSDQIV